MKKLLLLVALTMTFSINAQAFSLNNITDAKDIKMRTCLMSEAKKALASKELTSENVDKKAAEIAAVCAASESMEVSPEIVKQAAEILKSLL